MFAISTVVKGYLYKGLFAAIIAGAVWGNIQLIDAKNKRITALELTAIMLQEDKDLLKKDIVNLSKSEVVSVGVRAEVKQAEVKVEKAKTTANTYVDRKLVEIETRYSTMEKTAANLERKRVDISLERAKGLWLAFCLQEPEERACKN